MARIIPVLHGASSVQRLVDMARLVYSLSYEQLVVTKAYGAAAQHGIAEAGRISLRMSRGLIVLPTLEDAVDLLRPEQVLLVDFEGAETRFDPVNPPVNKDKVLIVFDGGEGGFTPSELSLGETVYPEGPTHRLGTLAEAALILYHATRFAVSKTD